MLDFFIFFLNIYDFIYEKVENVEGAMGKICGFDEVSYPESSMESSMGMMEQAMRVDQGEGPDVCA